MACREGLALSVDILLRQFRVASDCNNVVRNINGDGMASYGHIVKEIKTSGWCSWSMKIDRPMLMLAAYLDLGRHVWFQFSHVGVCNNFNNFA
jgi:hypothetical protein